MKTLSRMLLVIAVLMLALFPSLGASAAPAGDSGAGFVPGEILVKFKPGVSATEIAEVHRQLGGRVEETIADIGVQVVAVPGQATDKARAYSANSKVQYAELNYLAEAIGTPDDSYFNLQWGMSKVQAPQAWDVTTGSGNTKIAILDTGIDSAHPDLAGKALAAINFTTSATTGDIYGHGTHVAGIAAANTNNAMGVAGLGYTASLMNVKVLGDTGSGSYSWIASGIDWAADNGAQVINMSLGGTSSSSALQDAVNYAWNKGVVVVAAAGNNASTAPFYPAYYANTIAVAASNEWDQLSPYSDYGDWVDVAAPGSNIYSTLPGNTYGNRSGTSMASPHVAGLAALVFSVVTDTNGDGRLNDEVRSKIEVTADYIGNVGAGSGRINAYKAVSGATQAPAPTGGSISGKVTDSATGVAIAGATVNNGSLSALTDSAGSYVISNVPAGSYTVTAAAAGYQTVSASVSVTSGATTAANFALIATVAPIAQQMWVDSIAFRSTGKNLRFDIKVVSNGTAVANAQVAARLDLSGGGSWSFSGVTDSAGVVSFALLKASPGNYLATVTGLTAGGHTWDSTQGVTSAGYTLLGR